MKRYKNPPGALEKQGNLWQWFCFFAKRLFDRKPPIPPGHVLAPEQVVTQLQACNGKPSLTWLGHVAFIIRLNGKTILTDPYLTNYASPIIGFGPKRFVPSPISIDQLPQIDIILVSHNHYDHLDLRTLRAIANKEHIQVLVPLGLANYFRRCGYQKITELDWHQQWQVEDVCIHALPVYHYSKRSLWDQNTSLWAGFSILDKHTGKKLFFGGDTAYGPEFKKLGECYGPFDYGLIGIATYDPQLLMKFCHAKPKEAIKIARDLKVKTIVSMHWGTVILSNEPPFEPPEIFLWEGQLAGIASENLWNMAIGETRLL